MCYSRQRSEIGTYADEMLRFLPQDFHNCGKHCGKRGRFDEIFKFTSFFGLLLLLSPAFFVVYGVLC